MELRDAKAAAKVAKGRGVRLRIRKAEDTLAAVKQRLRRAEAELASAR